MEITLRLHLWTNGYQLQSRICSVNFKKKFWVDFKSYLTTSDSHIITFVDLYVEFSLNVIEWPRRGVKNTPYNPRLLTLSEGLPYSDLLPCRRRRASCSSEWAYKEGIKGRTCFRYFKISFSVLRTTWVTCLLLDDSVLFPFSFIVEVTNSSLSLYCTHFGKL